MSQHDFDIANQGSSSARSDINNALKALASLSSGATAPSTTYANMLWYDTGTSILKVRAEADDAWINICYLDQTSDKFHVLDDTEVVDTSGTQTGLLGDQAEAIWEAGSGTTESLISPAKLKAAIESLGQQIGDGQTWQDMSGSRAYGTSYQNTTGRSIMVASAGRDNQSFQVSTDNTTWVTVGNSDTDQDLGGQPGGFIIPNQHYYRWTGSGSLIGVWAELR